MVNRLWMQLTLAFTAVVLVALGAIAVMVNRATDTEFRQYVTHSEMRASGSGVQQLAAYYREHDGWEGVEDLLEGGVSVTRLNGAPAFAMPRRPGMAGTVLDVLLADAEGRVVYDSTGEARGRLDARERARALSITEPGEEEVIGYLLLSVAGPSDFLGQREKQFLQRVREILIIGTVLAAGVGLIAGALLSRGLTAPLQRLANAARAVAARDFSRRVRVEGSAEVAEVAQAFNEMTAALEQSERQRRNMVADVAHELRTPLSVLQGNLRAILDDVYALEKGEIARLYDETRFLSRLVDDVQELALVDAGQLHLNLRPTDSQQVIEQTLESFGPVAESRGVTLSARLPGTLPQIQADPDRLAQVLRNLVSNALRHTPAGGSVTVEAVQQAANLEISVRDTGEGISPEDLPHVFERFWRADASRARSVAGGGTGLGLSVAQSLVESQQGRIWAESIKGQGSRFAFTLPLAQGKAS
jgi:two-component system OmpR family sensor kinase/two-component system sensor histidine kinase BaeS